jgi:hypothetical protein
VRSSGSRSRARRATESDRNPNPPAASPSSPIHPTSRSPRISNTVRRTPIGTATSRFPSPAITSPARSSRALGYSDVAGSDLVIDQSDLPRKGQHAMSGIRRAAHLREPEPTSVCCLSKCSNRPRTCARAIRSSEAEPSTAPSTAIFRSLCCPWVTLIGSPSTFTIRFARKTHLPTAIHTRGRLADQRFRLRFQSFGSARCWRSHDRAPARLHARPHGDWQDELQRSERERGPSHQHLRGQRGDPPSGKTVGDGRRALPASAAPSQLQALSGQR